MAAGNYSFTIEQGATTDFELVYILQLYCIKSVSKSEGI